MSETPISRLCMICKKVKNLVHFARNKKGRYGHRSACRDCTHAQNRKTYYLNVDRTRARKRESAKRSWRNTGRGKWTIKRLALRELVFSHYGKECECCGESNYKFLTIDHINSDGHKTKGLRHRAGHGLHYWLVKNNFPPGFRLLCWNCNCGRAHNGGICPHQENISKMFVVNS